MKVSNRTLGCSRQLALWPLLGALVVLSAACGNNTGNAGEQIVELDALDVDFDTLDVDISGVDIASLLDVQKQDTIGADVLPDVQVDTGPDVQLDIAPDVQVDVTLPECVTDTDCTDDFFCTTDTCANGKCSHEKGTGPCDDGSACTVGDVCADGACLPGEVTPCADDNPCTADSCDPSTGCVNAPTDATCTDGSTCTLDDACVGGKCQAGLPQNCDDGFPCTDDVCDPQFGCIHLANAATCDDGDDCTVEDHCSESYCVSTPKDCDDGNPCTNDACGADGCTHILPDAWIMCDDNNICTDNDHCDGAGCTGDAVYCGPTPEDVCTLQFCDLSVGCTQTASTAPCDDGDICTQSDTCLNFVCLGGDVSPCVDGDPCTVDSCVAFEGCANQSPTNCDDGNGCTTDSCNVETGCVHDALPGETMCDDGDACTEGTLCGFGVDLAPVCGMGGAVNCDDGTICTTDSCDPKIGCVYLPSGLTCTDDDVCTTGDFCAGHFCVGNGVDPCDDKNACTLDTCNPGVPNPDGGGGGCVHSVTNAGCDDGDPCTGGDWCSGISCVGGTAPGCDDANMCTLDFCNTVTKECSHTPNESSVCDDGNVCTMGDTCGVGTGVCVGTLPIPCPTDNVCQSDKCDPILGCTYASICDDGNPCTLDACDLGACSYEQLAVFHETFANGNVNGWTLGEEWEIGTATKGPVGNLPPGDPGYGHSTSDAQIAGVVIGGNAKTAVHDYYWLTSPVIDTSKLIAPQLEFWRWLDSDLPPYMTNTVEAWDGTAWKTLWITWLGEGSSTSDGPLDTFWTRQVYDLTAVSNANLQVRFGFKIADDFVFSGGSWNLDDVTIGESGVCINPMGIAAAPPKKALVGPPRKKH